jgi:orotidine-5'-phosphate decarboxylase
VYKRKITASSFVRKSKLIIGLDLTADMAGKDGPAVKAEKDRLEREALKIISQTAEHAVAFKINRQLVLPIGLFDGIPRIVDAIHDAGITAIADIKLNDIGNTNKHIAKYYFDAGFDALIVNPLVGMEGGLSSVFEMAVLRKKGIILGLRRDTDSLCPLMERRRLNPYTIILLEQQGSGTLMGL